MTPPTTRRNAAVLAVTAASVGVLFLFPSSTNHTRRPQGRVAPAGVVPAAASPSVGPGRTRTAPGPTTYVVNGSAAETRYGPVQVQIRVRAGRVLSATAVLYPQDSGRDREINDYAVPILQRETVQAQSARVDAVSGATYTSDGYQRSLQAALDAAHLGS